MRKNATIHFLPGYYDGMISIVMSLYAMNPNRKPEIFMKENLEGEIVFLRDKLHKHRKSDDCHGLICS